MLLKGVLGLPTAAAAVVAGRVVARGSGGKVAKVVRTRTRKVVVAATGEQHSIPKRCC
jgi:hypothetical protein